MKRIIPVLLILSVIVTVSLTACETDTVKTDSIEESRYRVFVHDGGFAVDVDSPKPLWINGVNTPWDSWNDFGSSAYNPDFWDEHFRDLVENGVNASRVWINCNNGQKAVIIDDDGIVSGVSDKHWEDLDSFFEIARKNQIYIMATFTSFDHFKQNSNNSPQKWRNLIQSDAAIESFVEHYTVPFIERYKENPFLWSVDLMNEPDWVHENEECGRLDWEDLSNFFAHNAAAIHENSDVLVTVGNGFPKYNSDESHCMGNKVSDEFLQSLYDNPNAYLDFWSPHYYEWVGRSFGHAFTSTPYGVKSDKGWGLDSSKPAVIGETAANGSHKQKTLKDDYEDAITNGWQGVMAWTSNGVDNCGGFDEVIEASRFILESYPELVFPLKNSK